MNWAAITWLCLMVVFIVLEASTVTMVSLWFAAGALVAMIAELLGAPGWIQLVLFFVVSGVLLSLLRPLVRKYFTPKITKTNVDAMIGTVGLVTVTVDNISAQGKAKLGHMEWSIRSTSGAVIPEGTLVRVDRIEGVKAFVSPVEVKSQVKTEV